VSQNHRHFAHIVDAVNTFDFTSFRIDLFKSGAAAVSRIGKVDAAFAINRAVVWRVDSLAFKTVSQDGDRR
jgi:hypothetical protein